MMNKPPLSMYLAVLLLLALFATTVAPALATPPDRETVPLAGSFVLAECDGFNVIDEYSGWATLTYFYDDNGNLVRITYHGSTRDRIYNSVTGFAVYSNFAYNQALDPAINEYFIRGLAYNITVPGYGIVYFDSGLGIFVYEDGEFVELQFSGNYQADTGVLCEAMDQSP